MEICNVSYWEYEIVRRFARGQRLEESKREHSVWEVKREEIVGDEKRWCKRRRGRDW